ncbi:formate dehydrogenase subunit gamma [Simplicispira suum]|uniref:Formate dehydrogenase subunit gamma n=1 Tax=Simplicispira suum TaxID=2109915 RepID=A0A2S0MWP5_9BURK|nr:formate dehydrogenase subunit gamma [Simplicispira suum]AVO40320.1 formate dehydrogenase subunit gamma [Simplicispira suum]
MNQFLSTLVFAAAALLVALGLAQPANAQPAGSQQSGPVGAVAPALSEPATGAVRGQNIFDVQPDASTEAGYRDQTNGERAKVQPGNNAPMWRQVAAGATGYSSLPVSEAPEAGNLIQGFVKYPFMRETNAGEAWRQVRNRWILPYGAALLGIVVLTLALFFVAKGPLGRKHPESERKFERFTPFERAAHWSNAFAFVVLAISGLVMAFGKFFLLPVLGLSITGWLAYALKYVHNFMGPLFAVSLAIIIVIFVKDNIATLADFRWLTRLGGLLGDEQLPSHRFNAGEKGLFWWGVTLPGVVVVGSGLVLDKLIPGLGELRGQMQLAHMLHASLALWMVALIIGHIYMGTIGMRGAYRAMKTGYVTEGWADEHHKLWADDIRAGRIPAQRSNDLNPAPERPAAPLQA